MILLLVLTLSEQTSAVGRVHHHLHHGNTEVIGGCHATHLRSLSCRRQAIIQEAA